MSLVDIMALLAGLLLVSLSLFYITAHLRHVLARVWHARRQKNVALSIYEEKISREIVKTQFKKEWERTTWSGYRSFCITRIKQENAQGDVLSFYFEPHDDSPLAPYKPGQHIILVASDPDEEKSARLVRCYSLSEASEHKNYYRITVRKNPGSNSMSTLLHEKMKVGDTVKVQAPSGHFVLNTDTSRPVVMIAGGIGITPFLSMLEHIRDTQPSRCVWLFYGARNSRDHIMRGYMEQVRKESPNVKLRVCYSRPLDTDTEGIDYDHAQRVTIDLIKQSLPSSNYEFYMCGPGAMQNDLIEGLTHWGVPESDIHYESFGGDMEPAKPPAKEKFRIFFSKSNKEVEWDGNSILSLAEKNEIHTLQRNCGVGVCGNCKCSVKEGSFDYLKEPGYEFLDSDSCLPCISVPTGDLVLDA